MYFSFRDLIKIELVYIRMRKQGSYAKIPLPLRVDPCCRDERR